MGLRRFGQAGSLARQRRASHLAVGLACVLGLVAGVLAGGLGYAAQTGEAAGAPAGGAPALPVPLAVAWVYSMGPDPGDVLPPKVVGGRVYVSHDGKLYCLDALTGAEQWKFEPKEARVTTSPVPVGQVIVVGTSEGELIGFNAADGKEAWKTRCGGAIAPDPLLFGEVLILGAREMVYGVDPVAGAPRWVSSLTSAASVGPITDGSGVYFLCQNGSVQSIEPTRGRFRWNSQTIYGPRAFPPVMADHRVVVASSDTMMAVARSGAISWTREMPAGIGAQPTVLDDTMYVPCVDGVVYALYARSGRDQHKHNVQLQGTPVPGGLGQTASVPITAPVAVSGNLMILGTAGALVNAVDMGSGEVKWMFRCRAPDQPMGEGAQYGIYAPLVVADSALYCITGDGDLYCFSGSASDGIPPSFSELKPDAGSAQPGKGAIDLSFVVTDDGSGVDPASVAATMDGTAVKVRFDPVLGKGEAHFASLPDGSHIVKVTAKDFRGNEGSARWSFLTDKSILPPEQPGTAGTRGTTPGQTGTLRGRTTQPGGTTTLRPGR